MCDRHVEHTDGKKRDLLAFGRSDSGPVKTEESGFKLPAKRCLQCKRAAFAGIKVCPHCNSEVFSETFLI